MFAIKIILYSFNRLLKVMLIYMNILFSLHDVESVLVAQRMKETENQCGELSHKLQASLRRRTIAARRRESYTSSARTEITNQKRMRKRSKKSKTTQSLDPYQQRSQTRRILLNTPQDHRCRPETHSTR